MTLRQVTENDLKRELSEYRDRYPKLPDDDLFVMWFLRAFITDDDSAVESALCGAKGDKNVDAVLTDDHMKIVFVVQGKYRRGIGLKSEKRNEVISFAHLAQALTSERARFDTLMKSIDPAVAKRLEEVRERVVKRGYQLQFLYVTTGKCSKDVKDESARIVRSARSGALFQLFDGSRILLMLADYFDGVAPPVPTLDLEIESGRGIRSSGILTRYDSETDIESWVFSMSDSAVAGLYDRAGIRLFARNVRGYLGSTEINHGIEDTLEEEPEHFWYYNNGVTIVCDDATQETSRGSAVLRVTNPQVINGQQTTRTLASLPHLKPKASVLVRVIRVPRAGKRNHDKFETLVSKIVAATNRQNSIRPSDLMANDRRQIEMERQFRKLDYLYLRKRMTKREARRSIGRQHFRTIKKEEVAQAVAACDLDPFIVREGKDRLFEERWYGHVFPTSDPLYYLARYWLIRQASLAARGKPVRAYAKWLVSHFVWQHLSVLCRGRTRCEAFRQACERHDERILKPLTRAIDLTYNAAHKFYLINAGKGQSATDVSTFFKRRHLDREFNRFWNHRINSRRTKFTVAWKGFESAVKTTAAE